MTDKSFLTYGQLDILPIVNLMRQLAWLTLWRCHMTERVQVNMHEAQSQLSQLAERAWQGDTVVTVKDGKSYLNLLPHVETSRARKPGRLKGKIQMSADLEKTPEDIIDRFEDRL